MPPTHTDEGLRAAHEIRTELPAVAVLVLSQYVEVAYARELLAESAKITGGCWRYCVFSTVRAREQLKHATDSYRTTIPLCLRHIFA